MKRKLKNVTITLDESVARWARMEAAKADTSVSKLLGKILEQQMAQQAEYSKAMKRALDRKPFLRGEPEPLSREEANNRADLR